MRDRRPNLNQQRSKPNAVSLGRHDYRCTVCAHPRREEIEQSFINWHSPKTIGRSFSVSRDAIYRHAHALGLLDQRRRNVRVALEHIIEHAGDVEVNASAVVAAVSTCARINSRGEWVERHETINLDALFGRMSVEELEAYAREGKLPDWFRRGAAGSESQRGSHDG